MPRTEKSLDKARRTRAQNQATQPLYMLAKALQIKPTTLRAKLLYHGQKTAGVPLAQLLETLRTKTHVHLTAAVMRRLVSKGTNGNGGAPPPVMTNPRPEAPPGKGRQKNLRLALIALTSVEQLILPLRPGHYGQRELLELEALDLLRRIDKED